MSALRPSLPLPLAGWKRGDKLYEAFNNLKPAQQRYPRAFCRRLGIEIEPFINSWVDGKVEAARALCKTGEYEKALELSQTIRRIGEGNDRSRVHTGNGRLS